MNGSATITMGGCARGNILPEGRWHPGKIENKRKYRFVALALLIRGALK